MCRGGLRVEELARGNGTESGEREGEKGVQEKGKAGESRRREIERWRGRGGRREKGREK